MNWEPYKNRHRGELGVLVCTGATLAEYIDGPKYPGVTVGVNTAIFAGLDLDFLFIQDPGNPGNPYSYVSRPSDYDCYRCRYDKFYGVSLSPLLRERAEAAGAEAYEFASAPLVTLENGAKIEDPDMAPYFSSNLSETPPAAAGSISFPALQAMLWMGFGEIIVVGADIVDNRRYNDDDNPNDYVAQNHLARWRQFARWAGEAYDDVRIRVLRPLGLQGVFPEARAPKQAGKPQTPRNRPKTGNPTLHMMCPPNTVLDGSMPHCAFSAKIERLAPALAARGWDVVVYGHERSKIEGCELEVCMNDDTLALAYGREYLDGGWQTRIPKCEIGDACTRHYVRKALTGLNRSRDGDFVLHWFGHSTQIIGNVYNSLAHIEPSVGYFRTWAPYAAYETNFLRSFVDGLNNRKARWMDAVIPSIIDPADFEYRAEKAGYMLFIGRLDKYKCPQTAIEACRRAGVRLVVAGQGRIEDVWKGPLPDCVEFVGYADSAMRRELLAGASAVIIPSNFSEPNCFVAAEAAVSGTPVIASGHSGLVDNVVHGVTGWLCSTMYEFVWAVGHAGDIDPAACARWGENYHLDRAVERYEYWFWKLRGIYGGNDWYGGELPKDLDALGRIYP